MLLVWFLRLLVACGWCRFVETCCDAYQVLRENRDLFIGLFSLMLSTGIPELQCAANPNHNYLT